MISTYKVTHSKQRKWSKYPSFLKLSDKNSLLYIYQKNIAQNKHYGAVRFKASSCNEVTDTIISLLFFTKMVNFGASSALFGILSPWISQT